MKDENSETPHLEPKGGCSARMSCTEDAIFFGSAGRAPGCFKLLLVDGPAIGAAIADIVLCFPRSTAQQKVLCWAFPARDKLFVVEAVAKKVRKE